MPATQPSKDLRPLCHEHLLEMRLNRSFLNNGDDATQATTYGCTEPDCLVRYNTHRGYFMLSQRSEEHTSELQSRGHLVCRLLLEKKNRCGTLRSRWHA